jgi:competence protein ComEC
VPARAHRHPTARPRSATGTADVVIVAVLVAVAVATGAWAVAVVVGVLLALVRSPRLGAVALVLAGSAVIRTTGAWDGLRPDALGPVDGWATVVGDPQVLPDATRVVLSIEGERFESWVRGRVRRQRAAGWNAGDHVRVAGIRQELAPARRSRVASQHVVGELDAEWFGDATSGGRAADASNRVRAVIARGAAHLPDDQAALTRGLVIGDDRDEPPAMLQRFRDAGLSHLTAVSGQNVALLLAAAGPLLRRMRPLARWAASIGLIGWFVLLTRAEPSVLRAGVMAALGATAFVMGRQAEPLRVLAVAVIVLLLVDPLLAWSVGFWLSVGATAGVVLGALHLAPRLARLGPLALPVAITLGAQCGVVIPSLLVFGHLSVTGTVANLVAVPVAGLVMLYGLPACLLAGTVPAVGPVVMAPVGWGVWWVDAVATVAAAAEPPPPWSWLAWGALVTAVVWLVRCGATPPRR